MKREERLDEREEKGTRKKMQEREREGDELFSVHRLRNRPKPSVLESFSS